MKSGTIDLQEVAKQNSQDKEVEKYEVKNKNKAFDRKMGKIKRGRKG